MHFGDETRWTEYHPPARWDEVTAEPDHPAGVNTPYVDEIEEDFDEDEDYDTDEDFESDEDYETELDGPSYSATESGD